MFLNDLSGCWVASGRWAWGYVGGSIWGEIRCRDDPGGESKLLWGAVFYSICGGPDWTLAVRWGNCVGISHLVVQLSGHSQRLVWSSLGFWGGLRSFHRVRANQAEIAHNLRVMLVITSLGAPWWVDLVIMRQPVKRVLKTAIIRTCAPKCQFRMVSMYKSECLTSAQVDEFWSRVKRALSKW